MKRHWIEFTKDWMPGPMSYWVHIEADGSPWNKASSFNPPLPRPIAGSGYASYCVEFNGINFRFASLDEIRVCIRTLSRKLLPTTIRLSRERGGSVGPNGHWLSKLPAKARPWRFREKAVKYLCHALRRFEAASS